MCRYLGSWKFHISAILDNKYGFKSGTSMATPHITGVVANLLNINNDLTMDIINKILVNNGGIIIDGKCENDYNCTGAIYECGKMWNNNNTEWEDPRYADDITYSTLFPLSSTEIIIVIVCCAVGGCLILFCVICCIKKCCCNKNKHQNKKKDNLKYQKINNIIYNIHYKIISKK
eukprot:153737_1